MTKKTADAARNPSCKSVVLEIHNLVRNCEVSESVHTEQLIKQCFSHFSVEQCVVCMAETGVWQNALNATAESLVCLLRRPGCRGNRKKATQRRQVLKKGAGI